jgi:hypothetical protein
MMNSRRLAGRAVLWLTIVASGAIVPSSARASEILTFDLVPTDGIVTGPPGSTVGWGYSLTNQSASDWLVTTALNSDLFLFGTPALLFDFPDLAPGSTVFLPFDEALGTGLYQLTWDLSTPDDFANFGRFTLSAQWWNGDPLNGGIFVKDAPDSVQAYFAVVSETATVPEPSTIGLCVVGLAVLLMGRRQRAGHKR